MLFYFSGTGNSQYVANMLAALMEDTVISIPDCLQSNMSFHVEPSEKVGLVTPVYFYGLPSVVEDFLSHVKFDNPPSIYLVLTFGSFTAKAGQNAKKFMLKYGMSLDYIFSIKMPENYIPLFKVPGIQEREKLLIAAKDSIESIAEHLKSEEKGDYDTEKGMLPGFVSFFSRLLYRHGMTTRKFKTSDACNSCGLCINACQLNIIELKNGRPTWTKKKCTRCLSCLHHCPQNAIQLGILSKNKERYVCPLMGCESHGKD